MSGEQDLKGKEQEVVETEVKIIEKEGEKYVQVPDEGGKLPDEIGKTTEQKTGAEDETGEKKPSGEPDLFEGLSREELIKKIQEKDNLVA